MKLFKKRKFAILLTIIVAIIATMMVNNMANFLFFNNFIYLLTLNS